MDKSWFYGLTGTVVTPKEPLLYTESRQEWNRAIQKYPAVIVYCHNKQDVSNAIIWSEEHDVPIRVRNGGHNYEGYSTGNCVLVIDVSSMNSISIHDEQVTIGGGVNNSELYSYVSSRGYPFPGGTCPTVGVSGYALGGGWGLSCRLFGLGCDSLVELELVDYKGRILTANASCNSDLFWACRGAGGGNFGVVVSMTFRLPPKVDKVTFIELFYPDTSHAKQTQFLTTWQIWLAGADRRIGLIASMYRSPEEGFAIYTRGIFYGTPQEARQQLKPLIDLGGGELNLEWLTFYEAITKIGESYPTSQMFKSTGRFVVQPFSPHVASQVTELIQDFPEGSVYSALTLYALGGKTSEKSSNDTAFFYRRAKYIIGIQSVWTDPQYEPDNVAWVQKKFRYLEYVTDGSYVNFPYAELCDYMQAYYGLNARRLKTVKDCYDPYNVFTFPQSIPLSYPHGE